MKQMGYCSNCDKQFNNYNTHKKSAKHRRNKYKFILTDDLNLMKPFEFFVANFISRFETNDINVY